LPQTSNFKLETLLHLPIQLAILVKTADMKTLFNEQATEELLQRLNQLKADRQPCWGKMNAAQMLAHCQAGFRVYFGEEKFTQSLAGRIFGPIAKRKLFNNKRWPKNLPTAKQFVIADERVFEEEKRKLVSQVQRFTTSGILINAPKHPFFGRMNNEDWSRFGYLHLDHHLNQFGV
jgi:hypothetical protein